MATAIARMKFRTDPDALNGERINLAQQADKLLNYGRLARAIAAPGALLFTLRKLEIDVLQTESVAAYMRKKVKTGMWSGTRNGIAFMVSLALLGVAAVAVATSMPNENTPSWMYALQTLIVGSAGICGIATMYTFIEDKWGSGQRTVRKWDVVPLASYAGNVPEFSLGKAVQIKQELPGAEFAVVRLIEERQEKVPLPDPFLVVSYKGETCYIDVWDEKEYEAKL